MWVAASAIRPIFLSDFGSALSVIKPSCDKAALEERTQQVWVGPSSHPNTQMAPGLSVGLSLGVTVLS